MNAPVNSRSIDIPTEFQTCFERQRAAYLAAPEPSYAQRIADLKSLARLLKDNKDELVAAINADYGNRSEFETLFAEYFVVLETIADATKNLKKWMKPQRRHVDFMTYPLARNRVIPQPLGVVGLVVAHRHHELWHAGGQRLGRGADAAVVDQRCRARQELAERNV